MCLIRVRQEEEEVIPTRVADTTTFITPIPPPPPPPPPPASYTNNLVPTTGYVDADANYSNYESSKYQTSNYHANNYTSNQQYAISVIDGAPTTIVRHDDRGRASHHSRSRSRSRSRSHSRSRSRRHRHRRRSGSREREVTTYTFSNNNDLEHDSRSMRSGVFRSRSIDYRRRSGYDEGQQDPRGSYRYIDPRGSSQRVVSGGTAVVKTTKISRSESRREGREREREKEMYAYGNSYGRRSGSISHVNPRMSTASYKSYGGGRRSRERVIVVDDEHGRVRYY